MRCVNPNPPDRAFPSDGTQVASGTESKAYRKADCRVINVYQGSSHLILSFELDEVKEVSLRQKSKGRQKATHSLGDCDHKPGS